MTVLISYVFAILIIPVMVLTGYWIIKKKKKKKLGIIFLSVFVGLVLLTAFGDKLFTKKQAKDLLNENGINLFDEFKILNNESGSMDEYYHVFEIEISESDKSKIISEIRNSTYFGDLVKEYFYLSEDFLGKKTSKTFANYRVTNGYERQSFEMLNENAFVRDIIRIDTVKNTLRFNRLMD